jgi:hypothetical protein
MTIQTRGVVFVHSAAAALCPHVEWAVNAAVSAPLRFDWSPQPAEPGSYRAEALWHGPAGLAARLTSTLKRFPDLRFEVTEEPTARTEGLRFSFTPRLGLFQAATGPSGDITVPETRLREVMRQAGVRQRDLAQALRRLLGEAWDDELEPFRYGGEAGPVRWLRQVV